MNYAWLKDTDFEETNPVTGKIHKYIEVKKADKVEKVLQFVLSNGEYRQMSIWGQNWNELVKFNADDALWPGTRIRILQMINAKDGSKIKRLEVN